ncbi:MAG: hypothetical protein U5L45_10100 [Saprospiraceae bacterium]|nr:hypothetical protein [Saprospiraceae bacterium]
MVHFSGKARKMNHLSSFSASEASAVKYLLFKYQFYKMKNYLFFALIVTSLFTVSCSDDETTTANSDKMETKDISRDGAIETELSTDHFDAKRDVITTTHKVWKNGVLVNTIVHIDTLPALGTGTLQAADAKGEATTANGQKDYELYITVK